MGNKGEHVDTKEQLDAALQEIKGWSKLYDEQEVIIESQGRAINTLAKQLDQKQTEINQLRGRLGLKPTLDLEKVGKA